MNVKCLICSDNFLPNCEIYSTICGHLFHYICLLQWITRSKTCPQCRNKCTEKTIHRIYLSVEENVEITDINVLQCKLDNLQFEMKLKNKDIENAKDRHKTVEKQNIGLRQEIKDVESKLKITESTMHALKEQVSYFKLKSKNVDQLQKELNKLMEKLAEMKHVELIITGSQEQVNDMLRHNRDPQSLSVLVSTLKKELLDSDKKRKQIQILLRNSQKELQTYQKRLTNLNKENVSLQQEMEAHKNCDTERQYLKGKIKELQTMCFQSEANSPNSLSNSSIRRIIAESPAPLRKHLLPLSDKTFCMDSPSVDELVQSIKDSESPHFQVDTNSIGLSLLYNTKIQSKSASFNKYSIFKQPLKMKSYDISTLPQETSYDGLGGHSKDEPVPSPKHVIRQATGIKRPKSSTVSTAKFQKLAPQSQKRLTTYFTN